jgi:hypothetical protein
MIEDDDNIFIRAEKAGYSNNLMFTVFRIESEFNLIENSHDSDHTNNQNLFIKAGRADVILGYLITARALLNDDEIDKILRVLCHEYKMSNAYTVRGIENRCRKLLECRSRLKYELKA